MNEESPDKWLHDAADAARRLGRQYERELPELVEASGRGMTIDPTGIRGSASETAIPIRAEVIDLQADIKRFALERASLVRGTLRTGAEVSAKTGDRLKFMAGLFVRLADEDPDLCREIIDQLWSLSTRAKYVIDPPARKRKPFRIDKPCPECGHLSLWVDPARFRIGCGLPNCKQIWPIDSPEFATDVCDAGYSDGPLDGTASNVGRTESARA